jgi:hypothetical protein
MWSTISLEPDAIAMRPVAILNPGFQADKRSVVSLQSSLQFPNLDLDMGITAHADSGYQVSVIFQAITA